MYLGLDVGGTKIAAGLVNENYVVVAKTEVETEAFKGINGIVKNIHKAVDELGPDTLDGVGIGFAGQIDRYAGEIIYSPNMPTFRNIKMVDRIKGDLEDLLTPGAEVIIDNDANAFALAEYKVGKGKDTKNFIGLTVGTGVGGGVIINGELYHGMGFASELGHMVIDLDGRDAASGIQGTLEAYCSGLSIQRIYYEKTGQNKKAFDIELDALKDNNSPDYYVYMNAGKALGMGLASIVNIFDPEMIVIGGGIGRSKLLVEHARDICHQNTFYKDRKTTIHQSELSNDANVIGTAMLAMI